MNSHTIEKLRGSFGSLFRKETSFTVSEKRFDLLYQLMTDIQKFMLRNPEHQVVINKVRETNDRGVWIGWTLETRGRRHGRGHDEWLVRRLRDIFSQYEWDSRYEAVA